MDHYILLVSIIFILENLFQDPKKRLTWLNPVYL